MSLIVPKIRFDYLQLRLLIYCLTYILMTIQYKILTFPFYKYLRWLTGSYIDASNISMSFVSSRKCDSVELLELELALHSCFPWKKSAFAIKSGSQLTKPLSIGAFAMFLVKGEMMAFVPKI